MAVIAIDFETHLISNEQPAPKPVCLSWADQKEEGLIRRRSEQEKYLRALLSSNDLIVAHNAKFELITIYNHFPTLKQLVWRKLDAGQIFCTQLYEQLLNNVRKKQQHKMALDALVARYFDVDISADKSDPDAWRLRYAELEHVPLAKWPEAARRYAIEDSVWARKIREAQIEGGMPIPYAAHVRADFALNLMANIGFEIDQERVSQLENELLEYLTPRYEFLESRGFLERKGGKARKKVKYLREYILNLPVKHQYTEKGGLKVSESALQDYIHEHEDEVLQTFLDISKYEKTLTAFIPNLKQADPVIRTTYNAIVSSGRTSSRKSTHFPSVNIQQMPRAVDGTSFDIRGCFRARPGYNLVSIDYSGLELAATANQLYRTFKRGKMREAINEGEKPRDMHSMLAARIQSIAEKRTVTYEEFVAKKKEPTQARYRQLAKPINLGFPGGIGYDTMRGLLRKQGIKTKFIILEETHSERYARLLAREGKITNPNVRAARLSKDTYAAVYDELVGLKNALFDLYPELKHFLHKRHEYYTTGEVMMKKNDYGEWEKEPAYAFETCSVRRNYCTYTSFCNGYLMQTPSAVGAKAMVYEVVKKYIEDDRVNPLAFIHDELIFEVKKDDEKKLEIIEDIAYTMIDSMQKVLPFVRIAVEAAEMEYWSKAGGLWEKEYWKDNVK